MGSGHEKGGKHRICGLCWLRLQSEARRADRPNSHKDQLGMRHHRGVSFVVVLAALAAPAVPATANAATSWSDVHTLSGSGYEAQSRPSLAADAQGHVFAAWTGCRSDSGSSGHGCSVVAATRTGASSWSQQQPVWEPAAGIYTAIPDSGRPRIASNAAGDAAVAWSICASAATAPCTVLAAVRPHGASTWGPAMNVSDTTGGIDYEPRVAVAGDGDVTVAWAHQTGGDAARTLQARKIVGGAAQPLQYVTTAEAGVNGQGGSDWIYTLRVVADGAGRSQLVWIRQFNGCERIWAAREGSSGNFGAPAAVGQACLPNHQSRNLEVARDGDGVLVAYNWGDFSNGDLPVYALERDGAGDWAAPTALPGYNGVGRLAVNSNGDAAIVSQYSHSYLDANGNPAGDDPVTVGRRIDGSWETPVQVGLGAGFNDSSDNVDVAIDDAGVTTATWVDDAARPDNRNIWTARRVRDGAWETPFRQSDPASGQTTAPSVAANPDGRVATAWERVNSDATNDIDARSLVDSVPQPPVAGFDIAPGEPLDGDTVTFTSTSTDPDGQIATSN